jgi:hypothetical protein
MNMEWLYYKPGWYGVLALVIVNFIVGACFSYYSRKERKESQIRHEKYVEEIKKYKKDWK